MNANDRFFLNPNRAYQPTAETNKETWKKIVYLYYLHMFPQNGLSRQLLEQYARHHDHPKGGKGFINYCITDSHLLPVK